MGAYLSEPVTNKESEDGEGNNVRYGASCMQGWRVSQEDAHNCLSNFDENASLFAVYDGHGGAEVAIYLARHFPQFLKTSKSYQEGNWEEALKESYLKIDASIPTDSVISELQQIAKQDNGDKGESVTDYDEENVSALYEEATMPLEKLVALYQSKTGNAILNEINNIHKADQPCSSKAIQLPSKTTESEVKECARTSESKVNSSTEAEYSATTVNESSNNIEEKINNSENDGESSKLMPANSPESKSDTIIPCASNNHENHVDAVLAKENIVINVSSKITIPTEESSPIENGSKNSETVSVEKKILSDEASKNGDCEVTNLKIEGDISPSGATKARKGKVHPVFISPKKEESPKKTTRSRNLDANVYSSLGTSDSDSSESDDYIAGATDSDEDDESLENSSSTGNEDEEGNEEEEDDDEEDEDDDQFLSDIQEPGFDSGSTAVVAFLKWEGDKLGLWVANAGDSRCVVCRSGKAVEMSFDHKPEELKETRRIVAAGGKVTHDGRVNGGLNLSRAIGDHSYKQNPKMSAEEQMITPLPDIQHMMLDPEIDDFIVLACDGIWNSMSSQEVVDFISTELKNCEPISKICEKIFDVCLSPDTTGDGTGCDNMTAIIINLSKSSSSILKRRLSNSEEHQDEPKKQKIETEV